MTEVAQKTALNAVHRSLGATMVEFAGYDMPLHYPAGILKEHLHVRQSAGVFDISHMGQIVVQPRSGAIADAARALEALLPSDLLDLPEGRQRYSILTNETGGIRDDLIVANRGDHLLLVVNAACKNADLAVLREALDETCETELLDRALLALQGPRAEEVLAKMHPDVKLMGFMDVRAIDFHGVDAVVSRSGYTGEDGFEISLPSASAVDILEALLADDRVMPIGLGARDSLRLEAGLCLYGHDMDQDTSVVEAALEWAIQPARRLGGDRPGGFPGADVILRQIAEGAERRRVGLRPEGRAPMREGTPLFSDAAPEAAEQVGRITSGGFGPSLGSPVAMGYVPIEMAAAGTRLRAELRGRMLPVTVAKLPFVKPGYKRI